MIKIKTGDLLGRELTRKEYEGSLWGGENVL